MKKRDSDVSIMRLVFYRRHKKNISCSTYPNRSTIDTSPCLMTRAAFRTHTAAPPTTIVLPNPQAGRAVDVVVDVVAGSRGQLRHVYVLSRTTMCCFVGTLKASTTKRKFPLRIIQAISTRNPFATIAIVCKPCGRVVSVKIIKSILDFFFSILRPRSTSSIMAYYSYLISTNPSRENL